MMKRFSLGAALAAMLAAACNSGSGGGDEIDLGPDAEGTGPVCEPISQAGCDAGEKCANLIESRDPYAATAACVPAGDRGPGESCGLVGEPADGEGYDDCEPGLSCFAGACTPICDSAIEGACGEVDGLCVASNEFFEESIGMCADACHPVEQDCEFVFDEDNDNGDENGDGNGEVEPSGGCYFHQGYDDGVCLSVSRDGHDREQGDECRFLNDCPGGFGCLFLEFERDHVECAFYCEPTGDFDGAACGGEGGPGAEGYECRYLNGWFEWLFRESRNIPADFGICTPVDRGWLPACEVDPDGPGCDYHYEPPAAAREKTPRPPPDGAFDWFAHP